MSQNVEIEFKNILSESEYGTLKKAFQIPDSQIFLQENHYFDTPEFGLKEQNSALRIRKKQAHYELTLKQPVEKGLLETNQELSESEVTLALNDGILPSGEIKRILESIKIPLERIEYFGSLSTYRAQIEYKNGLLVFDHSVYLNTEDFELEYEVQNYEAGKENFLLLLEQYQIPNRKTKNKIQRFYDQKAQEK
ncbi:CYTH domain-containing protein [Bacillus sp. JJ1764]|uniref:CYTH domain-containing protein n=1 Tax=Bacillus sp. JJ1764 TaxID=3122964 RepID=UPI0030002755